MKKIMQYTFGKPVKKGQSQIGNTLRFFYFYNVFVYCFGMIGYLLNHIFESIIFDYEIKINHLLSDFILSFLVLIAVFRVFYFLFVKSNNLEVENMK